ncbi:MAG: endopeptidase La [Oscillospiraceae bacterium]|nr:endopeptidase La [Oscillospiraceae bacterium]
MAEKVKVTIDQQDSHLHIPAVALRGLVVFPNNVVHFEVARPKSIAAITWAMEHNSPVFLVAQRDINVEDPGVKDLYTYGTVAEIKQFLRMDEENINVLVEGKLRARLLQLETSERFLMAEVKPSAIRTPSGEEERITALVRRIKEEFHRYLTMGQRVSKEVVFTVLSNDDGRFISEYVPSNVLFRYQDKQELLEASNLIDRLERLLAIFIRENNILEIEREIQEKTSDIMEKEQRDYYLREEMNVILEELGEGDDIRAEAAAYKAKIDSLPIDADSAEKLRKEADRLFKMHNASQEATVIRSYLDTCLELPWGIETKDSLDLKKAESILNRDHYGMQKVKDRILEILAVRKTAGEVKGQIICLVGPPGVGKTSIAQSMARCMNRNYVRMSLGGVRDEAEIRGHRRTYIGSMPGRLISAVIQAKSCNPLILLDEIDKLGNDFRGDPAAALLEALDPEQNKAFKDHFLDIPFDLSRVLFVTTANSLDTIPRPLLDRMDVIELGSYTREEKLQIARRHLLPRQLEKTGLKGRVKLPSSVLELLIDGYTGEAGVRTLERTIAEVLRKCARQVAADPEAVLTLTPAQIEPLLGPRRRKENFLSRRDQVGVANGLAWTSIGGEVLPIEVLILENGSGRIELTGSLGEVMKESAKLALSYAHFHAAEYGIDAARFKNIDIHIHAPEGAVPKDGPSAGITLTTALISALSGIPVSSGIAMTGEITLHGDVLPIGGLREKSMAAYKEGIRTVLIPQENASDLYDVVPVVREKVTFIPVSRLDQVLDLALVRPTAASESRSVRKNASKPVKNTNKDAAVVQS